MDGAGFANKAGAKFAKNGVDADKDLPQAMGVLAVVRRMTFVQIKADRTRHFDRHGPDFYVDAE